MSIIKGSLHAGLYVPYLSSKHYQTHGSPLLSKTEKRTLYFVFLKYEHWKFQIGAFDFLDVVNHILIANSNYGVQYKIFDYLVLDEVQDLHPKTLALLSMHSKNHVAYAGDTA